MNVCLIDSSDICRLDIILTGTECCLAARFVPARYLRRWRAQSRRVALFPQKERVKSLNNILSHSDFHVITTHATLINRSQGKTSKLSHKSNICRCFQLSFSGPPVECLKPLWEAGSMQTSCAKTFLYTEQCCLCSVE